MKRIALAALSVALFASTAAAQNNARVIALDSDRYMVIVGTDTLMGMSKKLATQVAKNESELLRLRGQRAADSSMIKLQGEAVTKGDALAKQFKSYSDSLEKQVASYKELVGLLEKRKAPRIGLDLGGGVTGGSGALLAGLSVYRIRAWGFAQSGNIGALLGTSLPIW